MKLSPPTSALAVKAYQYHGRFPPIAWASVILGNYIYKLTDRSNHGACIPMANDKHHPGRCEMHAR